MHTRFGKRDRADLREAAGIMAGIITDGTAQRQAGAGEPRGKALRGAAHREGIHPVGAEAHYAADAARAELQLLAEAAFHLGFIIGKFFQFSEVALAQRGGLAPDLIAF